MNNQEADILNILMKKNYDNQRILSEISGHSLGIVNRSIKNLTEEGYLSKDMKLTHKAKDEVKRKSPKNAIVLAAGFGMRMVPINMEIPKALLEVKGEPLIERIIKQLHEVGISEIHVVVGFMKEKFEYLIDEYGVDLIVNPEYAVKNNMHTLKRAMQYFSNTYIIPCDIWCKKNPFDKNELYSWYMVSRKKDLESPVRVNRKQELVGVSDMSGGNGMVGIAYLTEEDSNDLKENIDKYCKDSKYDDAFWEEALYKKNRMSISAKVVSEEEVIEINTFEQLRELDSDSNNLKSEAIETITQALGVKAKDIIDITVLKKGMTNRSFLFRCKEKKYIMRIPGEGTEQLINRKAEAAVYRRINGKGICDEIAYINPENGYKITEYIEGARVCDPLNDDDIKRCMHKLREFHEQKMIVEHEFDLFGQIEFYETLWEGIPSVYKDYKKTKEHVLSLRKYINEFAGEKVLTHIDAVPDNFLFAMNEEGAEDIKLIDWEYAGMQDPHVDIAMFCIYAMYDRLHVDKLIDLYFTEGCPRKIRIKIYCYIAIGGLLWSNWCEYKRHLGVEFGEYSLRQYRFAKEYYKIVTEEMERLKENV